MCAGAFCGRRAACGGRSAASVYGIWRGRGPQEGRLVGMRAVMHAGVRGGMRVGMQASGLCSGGVGGPQRQGAMKTGGWRNTLRTSIVGRGALSGPALLWPHTLGAIGPAFGTQSPCGVRKTSGSVRNKKGANSCRTTDFCQAKRGRTPGEIGRVRVVRSCDLFEIFTLGESSEIPEKLEFRGRGGPGGVIASFDSARCADWADVRPKLCKETPLGNDSSLERPFSAEFPKRPTIQLLGPQCSLPHDTQHEHGMFLLAFLRTMSVCGFLARGRRSGHILGARTRGRYSEHVLGARTRGAHPG